MKKKYLFFVLLSSLYCKAQPFDLIFDHPWYLSQMQIDGSTNQIPFNTEVTNAILNFYNTTPYTFDLEVCQTLSGEITYPNHDSMLFPGVMSLSGDVCTIGENIDFETALFNFFQSHIGEDLIYDYIFVDPDPPNNILTIYSSNGNFVEFTEVPRTILGIEDHYKKLFSVYPNPVSERINIRNYSSKNLSKLRLLSIQGIVLLETNENHILTQNLSNGMYLLELIAEDGYKQVEKIIKK